MVERGDGKGKGVEEIAGQARDEEEKGTGREWRRSRVEPAMRVVGHMAFVSD